MSGTENWDTTKENIRPLRQGRPASAASFAEIPKSSAELKAKRDEFEEKIKNYAGDDPLAEWVNYITWVEANYPSGGSESKFGHLIKECCQEFYSRGKETKKYYDDERFIKLWIKMTAVTPPLKTYNFMMKHQIGILFPEVYISWAAELESVGNYMEAEKILDKGTRACSGYPDRVLKLEAQKKAMLDRDARTVMERGLADFAGQVDEEREALGGLRPTGKGRNEAPINRIGDNKIQLTRGVVRPAASQQSSSKPSVQICPENVPSEPGVLPDEVPFPTSEADRENYAGTVQTMRSDQKDPLALNDLPALSRQPLPESHITFQILADPPEKTHESVVAPRLPIDHKFASGQAHSKRSLKRPVSPAGSETDWSDANYKDFNPFKEPMSDRPCATLGRPGEAAPLPQHGQLFMWHYQKFPSGLNETSFEEYLAFLYRKNAKSQLDAARAKDGVDEKLRTLQAVKEAGILLSAREHALQAAEAKLREREDLAQQHLNVAAEALQLADQKEKKLDEKERLLELQAGEIAETREGIQNAEMEADEMLQKAQDVYR